MVLDIETMARSYAIPDLHGRYDLLTGALDAVAARAQSEPITLITLGDYVAKGADSRQVIETMAGLQRTPPAGWRVVCLMGNHDALMRDAVRNPETLAGWMGRGGDTVLRSYGGTPEQGTAAIPADHVEWLEQLALLHVDRHRVFVHAGLDNDLPLDRQNSQTLLWKRYPAGDAAGFDGRHVVHGHDPNRNGPLRLAGRTDLDTLAWSTGRLVVAVFDDDLPGGPLEIIEVVGAPFADLPQRAGV
jgi:serine/threonine protein phosphatase 1